MNETQLSILLLKEVVLHWTEYHSDVEIGSDPKKIDVLEVAKDVLRGRKNEIPPEVIDLYEKVYLRDVWT